MTVIKNIILFERMPMHFSYDEFQKETRGRALISFLHSVIGSLMTQVNKIFFLSKKIEGTM